MYVLVKLSFSEIQVWVDLLSFKFFELSAVLFVFISHFSEIDHVTEVL